MITVSVKADFAEVRRMLKGLDKQVVIPAANSAINKTLITVRNETAKYIKAETALPTTKIKQRMDLIRSNTRTLTGYLRVSKRPLSNLIEWVSPSKKHSRAFRKQPGVISKAWGKSKTYRGSFIGTGKNSGKALVFARTGPTNKSKIKALSGPSVRASFIRKGAEQIRDKIARNTFIKNFSRELQFRLDRKFK